MSRGRFAFSLIVEPAVGPKSRQPNLFTPLLGDSYED
jgi:hypothetical protein